jgi:hypothetical protein
LNAKAAEPMGNARDQLAGGEIHHGIAKHFITLPITPQSTRKSFGQTPLHSLRWRLQILAMIGQDLAAK